MGLLAIVALLFSAPGCGSGIDQILFNSGSAVGRTILDQLLTDIANRIAEQQEQQDTEPPDNGDNGDNGNGDGGPDDLVGDPTAGQTIYNENNCGSCHCADASGGCSLAAPALIGSDRNALDEFLRGSAPHPSKPALSDQQIVDMEAYLMSLP